MRTTLGFAVLLACSLAGAAQEKDSPIDPQKLVGKWEPLEFKKDAKAVVEFSKDGKVNLAVEFGGKAESYKGTYTIAGTKLVLTMPFGDKKDVTQELVVLKLTDDMLATEDAKGKKETFKRVK